MDNEWHIRRQVVDYSRRIYDLGLVAATDGNVTCRLSGDRILATPSGFCLGELLPQDLVTVSLEGRFLTGRHKPTSELPLHLAVYRLRADVSAVVHAHPPVVNAFSFAGRTLDRPIVPEAVVGLGEIATTSYATPSSPEGPAVIEELIGDHDTLILQRHGAVTVGGDLRTAYYRLEKLEHTAKVIFMAHQLGDVIPMSADELTRLAQVCRQHGWKPPGCLPA